MSEKKYIDQEVEKTFRSIDGIESAQTDDFFYSRLRTRMDRRYSDGRAKTDRTFAYSMAATFLLILLNMISLTLFPDGWADTAQQEDVAADLIYEYDLYDLSYYENLEDKQP
ncbi:MAG: hypothetical protein RI564_04205 [Gracilimonas sp.]|nr:hypothetical protein [Gracilimonas sp.]